MAARIGLFLATVLAIIVLSVLPLLTPWFTHAALEAAGSAELLGLTEAQARELSDHTVRELVLGPGDFDLESPDGASFYGDDERDHLADARLLLGLFLVAGGVAIVALGAALGALADRRSEIWAIVSRAGLATAVVVVMFGFISLVAFDSLFTLFHRVFFPGGNWAFDPSSQRLVQLYPFRFWQIAAAAMGLLVFILGLATWLLARRMSSHTATESTAKPPED